MAFPVSSRTTGTLITESIWNSDIVDNLNYLKGLAGPVLIEDDLSLATGKALSADLIYAGRYTVSRAVRRVKIDWKAHDGTNFTDFDHDEDFAAWGKTQEGGTGQLVLEIDNNQACFARAFQRVEQNNALNNAWQAASDPYFVFEFSPSVNSGFSEAFIGFRQTPGADRPLPAAEKYAGIMWTGAIWVFENSDGSGSVATSGTLTINPGSRNIVEIYIVGGTKVEYWLNGALIATKTTFLPTGDLEWEFLSKCNAGGGVGKTYTTLGEAVLQENLA
ncbi:MAG: hypothetical protein M0R06_10300 [Sphaerochaeta sp.]|jgi:hypothetical protein|nr:hypothetical protein [Sphaerochaeta sp.]